MRLGLGVDTGGTYTDAVIVDLDTGELRTKAKALTTRHDLSVGITNAIDNLSGLDAEQIRLVSVSTTLATNAVVEGRGARACLLGIGYREKALYELGLGNDFPVRDVRLVQGGHDILGEQIHPLDVEALRRHITETKDTVDAYGVSAYGGVRNPEHEIAARKMVEELSGLPVVCSHELTSGLDAIRRAVTAAFNARLIPVVRELLDAVRTSLRARGISAPLMVVKGDGHLVSDAVATERPIETILSGPAASLIGAKHLSGVDTGIVADMGGTTTDIAIMRNGNPLLNPSGATVGGWRTSVRAADIQTTGLGGDSHITLDRDLRLRLNPRRVIPVSLAATEHPEVVDELGRLHRSEWRSALLPPADFFIRVREANGQHLDDREAQICAALDGGAMSARGLSRSLGLMHPSLLNTGRLEELGVVGRIGLTPTDVLHADGSYTIWNVEAASTAVDLYADHMGVTRDVCIRKTRELLTERLATEILARFVSEELGATASFDCRTCRILLDKVLGDARIPEVQLDLSVKLPVVAIGAPAAAYFPPVAATLGSRLVVPEHAEVANAVGAITGNILETVEVVIEPIHTAAGPIGYTVHAPDEMTEFRTLDEAVRHAEATADRAVRQRAARAGAGSQVEIRVERKDQTGNVSQSHTDGDHTILLSTRVVATAIGKPDLFV